MSGLIVAVLVWLYGYRKFFIIFVMYAISASGWYGKAVEFLEYNFLTWCTYFLNKINTDLIFRHNF